MPEKTGYTEREYRIYGHKCTRRRYLIEWFGIVIRSVAIAIAVVIEATADFNLFRLLLLSVGAFLGSLYYGLRTMNVNGYNDEKPPESFNTQLFPWKAK